MESIEQAVATTLALAEVPAPRVGILNVRHTDAACTGF
jgi:hypothetical protein